MTVVLESRSILSAVNKDLTGAREIISIKNKKEIEHYGQALIKKPVFKRSCNSTNDHQY